jgi:hypothetical protein
VHSVRRIVALGVGSIFGEIGDVPSMLGFIGDSTVAGGERNPSHAVQELGSTARADQASFTSVFVAPGGPVSREPVATGLTVRAGHWG